MKPKRDKNSSSFKKKIVIGGVGFLLFVLIIASLFGKRGLIEIYRTKRKQEVLFERIEPSEIRFAFHGAGTIDRMSFSP